MSIISWFKRKVSAGRIITNRHWMFKTTQTATKLPGECPHLKDCINYDKTVIIQHMLQINPLFQLQLVISLNSATKI